MTRLPEATNGSKNLENTQYKIEKKLGFDTDCLSQEQLFLLHFSAFGIVNISIKTIKYIKI